MYSLAAALSFEFHHRFAVHVQFTSSTSFCRCRSVPCLLSWFPRCPCPSNQNLQQRQFCLAFDFLHRTFRTIYRHFGCQWDSQFRHRRPRFGWWILLRSSRLFQPNMKVDEKNKLNKIRAITHALVLAKLQGSTRLLRCNGFTPRSDNFLCLRTNSLPVSMRIDFIVDLLDFDRELFLRTFDFTSLKRNTRGVN